MNIRQCCLASVTLMPALALAQQGIHLMDTHTYVKLMVDEFEITDVTDNNDFNWDADLSVGGDLHRFVMKTEAERSDGDEDRTELQFLYSKAITPFWNLQGGVRTDIDPNPERDWAVVSLQGLAPYFFEVEAELFFAEGGQTSFRVNGEYELLLTQRLILTPEVELVAYGRNEPLRMIGSGVSSLEFDIRLRYEIKRELAPYFGISWQRLYGGSNDYAEAAGQDGSDMRFVLGLRAWF